MSFIITNEVLFKMIPMIVTAGGVAVGLEFLKVKIERKIKEKRGETTA